MKLCSRIYQADHRVLLLDFLSSRFTYLSSEQWTDRISTRKVLVNDAAAVAGAALKNGDIVSYEVDDFPEPDADLSYTIVYEDEWILGVNKPGNLLVHKAGSSITRNLVYLLRHSSGNPSYANIDSVNRLDRETSGIVLFSKDPGCLKVLHRDFASGKVEKRYTAVVHGSLEEKTMRLNLPIGRNFNSSVHYKFCVDAEKGKDACTLVETQCTVNNRSLILAQPLTGRTHQIRVHLSAAGCPVVGDKLYGMSEESYLVWRSDPARFSSTLECKRQALHCESMTIRHPKTGALLTIRAPLPEDMRQLMMESGLPVQEYHEPAGRTAAREY